MTRQSPSHIRESGGSDFPTGYDDNDDGVATHRQVAPQSLFPPYLAAGRLATVGRATRALRGTRSLASWLALVCRYRQTYKLVGSLRRGDKN